MWSSLTMVFSSSAIRASTSAASCLVICRMVEITRRRLRCSPASRVDMYLEKIIPAGQKTDRRREGVVKTNDKESTITRRGRSFYNTVYFISWRPRLTHRTTADLR